MKPSFLVGVFLFISTCCAQNSVAIATDHFLLTTNRDTPSADFAWLTETLEQAYAQLVREWHISFHSKIPIYLHSTSRDFAAATGMPGYMKAATVDQTIHLQTLSVLKRYTPLTIIIHELVHAYLAAFGSSPVPRWFAEGCATYISGSPDILPQPSSPLPGLRSLDTLLGFHQYHQQRQAYSDAREYVRGLIRIGGKESLTRFLRGLKRNPFEYCLDTVFHRSITDIERTIGQ